mmetsp:Transcript_68195/g.135162  ORF Transcript_68195/g.135162 Transcript_68195/m.135162 type:complete len:296 (+) Transcript_68195:91-978(+)
MSVCQYRRTMFVFVFVYVRDDYRVTAVPFVYEPRPPHCAWPASCACGAARPACALIHSSGGRVQVTTHAPASELLNVCLLVEHVVELPLLALCIPRFEALAVLDDARDDLCGAQHWLLRDWTVDALLLGHSVTALAEIRDGALVVNPQRRIVSPPDHHLDIHRLDQIGGHVHRRAKDHLVDAAEGEHAQGALVEGHNRLVLTAHRVDSGIIVQADEQEVAHVARRVEGTDVACVQQIEGAIHVDDGLSRPCDTAIGEGTQSPRGRQKLRNAAGGDVGAGVLIGSGGGRGGDCGSG